MQRDERFGELFEAPSETAVDDGEVSLDALDRTVRLARGTEHPIAEDGDGDSLAALARPPEPRVRMRETSGMLDIRSLADTYARNQAAPLAGIGRIARDDAPPMLGPLVATTGVLAPRDATEREDRRWLFFGFGFAAASALACAVGALVWMYAGAAAPPPAAPPRAGGEPAVVAGIGSDEAPVLLGEIGGAEGAHDADADAADHRGRAHRAERTDPAERDVRAERRVARASAPESEPEPEPEPEPVPPPAAASQVPPDPPAQRCDEVACLLDASAACCAKLETVRASKEPEQRSAPAAALPERPARAAINAGLGRVRGRVSTCGDRHGFSGVAKVSVTIGPDGSVLDTSTASGDTPFQRCVVEAVEQARFDASRRGAAIEYPFVIR